MYIITYPQYVHNITSHDTPMNGKKKTKKKNVILATRTEEVDKIGEKSKNGIIIKTLTPTM